MHGFPASNNQFKKKKKPAKIVCNPCIATTHPQPPTPHRRPLTATLSGRLLTGQMTVERNFEGTNSCVFMFNSEKNRREKREDQIVSIRCPRAPGPDYKGRHGAMTLCKELSDYGGQVSKLSQSAIDFYKTRCCRLERKKERDRQRQTDRQADRQADKHRETEIQLGQFSRSRTDPTFKPSRYLKYLPIPHWKPVL